MTVWFT